MKDQLSINPYGPRTRNPRLALRPILDQNSLNSQVASINIQKNCGPDNVCIPDLRMTAESYVFSLVFMILTDNEIDIVKIFIFVEVSINICWDLIRIWRSLLLLRIWEKMHLKHHIIYNYQKESIMLIFNVWKMLMYQFNVQFSITT